MTAREVALQVARDSAERGTQEALEYRAGKAALDARDRGFSANLAFGAIKMRRTLDWYAQPYVGDRPKPLPPVIAEILRLAIYELKLMSSADHAVVSQWVGLAKKYGHRGTAGLVNAVLRSLLRDPPREPVAEEFTDHDDYLGTKYSYPKWIVRQWRGVFGDKAEELLDASNRPAQPAVTVNRRKTNRRDLHALFAEHGMRCRESQFAEDSLLVDDGAMLAPLETQAAGAWWRQSESSAMVVDVLNPQPGETVVDACTGRGSKALQIAARLENDESVICIDRDARKLQILERRAAEAGVSVAPIAADATSPILSRHGDRILIDAPCSGTGVLGRHPEARWRKRPEDAERLAITQRALLAALAEQLFQGGAIVYAVCSVDPRETTEVVEPFVQTHGLRRGLIPSRLSSFETDSGDVLIPPGLEGRDGFYIARLER